MSGNDRRIEELQARMKKATREMDLEAARVAQAQVDAARVAQEQAARRAAPDNINAIQNIRYDNSFNVAGSGAYFTSTRNEFNGDHGAVISKIYTNHGNGFWSYIKIHENDFIFYKLFRGSFISRILGKLRIRTPRDVTGAVMAWDHLDGQGTKDCKLEATLGKTYLAIDELIAQELKDEKHRKFIKGIAKTDPENLKMISGLKTLDEGMTTTLGDIKTPDLTDTSTPQKITGKKNAKTGAWAAEVAEAVREVKEKRETGKVP